MAFCSILKKQAPIKVKMLMHNNKSFMTKNLRKAIMRKKAITHRQKFKNRFNKSRNYAIMKFKRRSR